jgi:uncharacterized protein (TIGR02466 family)
MHNHVNSLLSGVIYIDVDEKTGGITFIKNNYDNFPPVLNFEYTERNVVNSSHYTIYPKNKDICIFPSSLEHAVNINNSTKTRYSLVFTAFVRGKFGRGQSELSV